MVLWERVLPLGHREFRDNPVASESKEFQLFEELPGVFPPGKRSATQVAGGLAGIPRALALVPVPCEGQWHSLRGVPGEGE